MTTRPELQDAPDALTALAAVLSLHGTFAVEDVDLAAADDLAVMFWRDDLGRLVMKAVEKP